jgi:hypothetical protein
VRISAPADFGAVVVRDIVRALAAPVKIVRFVRLSIQAENHFSVQTETRYHVNFSLDFRFHDFASDVFSSAHLSISRLRYAMALCKSSDSVSFDFFPARQMYLITLPRM